MGGTGSWEDVRQACCLLVRVLRAFRAKLPETPRYKRAAFKLFFEVECGMVHMRDERVQIRLPGLRAAHHRGRQCQRDSVGMPNLFPNPYHPACTRVW